MTNGSELIKEVKELLDQDRAIPVKSALKLSLGMQVVLHDQVAEQGKAVKANTERLKLLETKNIILWIEGHPKVALFVVTIIVILSTVVDLRVVIAKALNIDL